MGAAGLLPVGPGGAHGPAGPARVPGGYRRIVTYQPANRFWTFQSIESGIYVLLTVALPAFAYWRTTTADA